MPRVKDWMELPTWLQARLRLDWLEVTPASGIVPPIGDPEYRVHRVGDSGWWTVDVGGAGGVRVEREGESHAYDDLPAGELKALVDAEGRACREAEQVETLYGLVLGNGVDPRALGRLWRSWQDEGLAEDRVIVRLATVLHDGLVYGNWPMA